ncbi:MAG: Endonuclease/exonuclease/phosphatase [Alphaproteobacteria bacterium]|nr:Endonuclease/exonuclease/phosphatase [Alphaproteobacteria bacterium]
MALLIWLGVVLLAVAQGLALLSPFHPFFELFVHFPAQYLAIGLTLAVSAVLARRYLAFALALGIALANLPPLWPYIGAAPPKIVADGPGLLLVSANLNHMHADAAALDKFLQATDADIVILTELAGQLEPALDNAAARFAHRLRTPGNRHNPFGLVVLARRVVQQASIHRPFGLAFPIVEFRYCLDGTNCLTVIALHAVRPQEADNLRDRMLGFAFERARLAGAAREHVLIVGDLNVTPFSPVFNRFAALGLRDTGLGQGWQPTWPSLLGVAGIPIDHALLSPGVDVRQYRRLDAMGSDHRPILMELRLPAKQVR